METNRLEQAHMRASRNGRLIDLIDTNFHANGFYFPQDILTEAAAAYFPSRHYDPDPRGARPARDAIAAYYRGVGIPAAADEILVTASSSESYNLIFNNLCKPGDNIVLPTPGYPLFEYLASFNHVEPRFYRLDPKENFRLDASAVEEAVDARTRLCVLISPNNPTGMSAGRAEIEALLEVCRKHRLTLVCDEVFSEFIYEKRPLARPAALADDVLVLTLNGISKMFACPDLKLSWILLRGPASQAEQVRGELEFANDMYLNCSSLTQAILPSLFERGDTFQRDMVQTIDQNRQLLISALDSVEELMLHRPTSGIHALFELRGTQWDDDEDFAVDLLEEQACYLHPGYLYGMDAGVYGVVSFLKERSALSEGLERLVAMVRSGR